MEYNHLLIHSKNEFESAYRFAQTAFNITNRLPERVFNKSFSNFICDEAYFSLSTDFWTTIQQLSQQSQDEYVIVGVLEPDPITYFFKEFSYYNWFKFPTNITASAYSNALHKEPENSPADALTYNSEIIVWIPLSRKWAIWMERSYDICILGFADKNCVISSNNLAGRWRSPKIALDELIAPNFKDQKIPKDFSDALIVNYSDQTT